MAKYQWERKFVVVDGQKVALAPREYDLYKELEKRQGDPASAEELEQAVTGEVLPQNPGQWTRIYTERLRKTLRSQGVNPERVFRNQYGKGYFMITYLPDGTKRYEERAE